MDFASLRASKARYALMLSLLSGLYFFQHASLAGAAVDADDALGLCQIDMIPKDIRGTLERRFYSWKIQESTNLVPKTRQKWASIAPLACPCLTRAPHAAKTPSKRCQYAAVLQFSDDRSHGRS